ncbi:MAG TPA: PIG-L family deacetylase [Thermomicrobiales bacterium]|jgi:LmbE family N-acetylglucosaminyl deacetylase|nr:PIG-L family deacetylase [Thermomicrobiales bacterium]HRA30658.1 PIG-L family deacetylase [Thermomicrobiales bacterium]
MRRLFVAPHPDDVALSCGGAVAIAARDDGAQIVTVFAGQPQGGVGAFARSQHERWGLETNTIASQRQDEDRCAAAALGDQVTPIWLDELDAIYRDPRYDSDEALFGRLLDEDMPTIDRIVEALLAHDPEELVVPLAIGHHVDHQIVLRAGRRLAARGVRVWAYADLPYALDRRAITPRLASGVAREVRLVGLDDDAFERKCRAIDCYASQLPVIFRDWGDHRDALDSYHRWIGGGRRAEAQWRVVPSRLAG